jgi:hypothetical protein
MSPKFVFVPLATHASLVWDVLATSKDMPDALARFGSPVNVAQDHPLHRIATVAVGIGRNGVLVVEIAPRGTLTDTEERQLREAVDRESDQAVPQWPSAAPSE